jgi:hypothetical protein
MTDRSVSSPTTPSFRRPASLFWPGFLAGFLLLSSLTCGALFMATGITRFNLAELQVGAAWTPPPAPPTTAAVAASPAGSAEDGDATAGDGYPPGEQLRNITSSLVNIRATPGYLGKPGGDVIAQVPPGAVVEIVGAPGGHPAVADGLVWWRIRYTAPDGGQVEGWIAEATASGVQILGR